MKTLSYKDKDGQKQTIGVYNIESPVVSLSTGLSTKEVMSQKAVTNELEKKANTTDVYNKEEVDNKIANIDIPDVDLSEYAKSERVAAIESWKNDAIILLPNYSSGGIHVHTKANDVEIGLAPYNIGTKTWTSSGTNAAYITIPSVTPTTAGVMSAEDKVKLDKFNIISEEVEEDYTPDAQSKAVKFTEYDGGKTVFPVTLIDYVIDKEGNSLRDIIDTRTKIVVANGESLSAEVGKYYRFDEPVETLGITLPQVEDTTHTSNVKVFLTTGSIPQITIDGNGAEVRYFKGYSVQANTTYELDIMFNGDKWVVAQAKVE